MDGKKGLAQQHVELLRQLKQLSSLLHEHTSSVDPSVVTRLDCRIYQLERTVTYEERWRSPFSLEH